MPYEDPLFLGRPQEPRVHDDSGHRSNASNAGSAVSLDLRSPNTEDARSPVSLPEEDLHTAITAPLLADHHHQQQLQQQHSSNNGSFAPNQSGSNLQTRGPSPQLHSLSPCTNASVCVADHAMPRWSLYLDGHPPHGHTTHSYHHSGEDERGVESRSGSVSDLYSAASRHGVAAEGGLRAEDNVSFNSEVDARRSPNGRSHRRPAPPLRSPGVVDGDGDAPQSPGGGVTSTYAVDTVAPSHSLLARLLSVITPSITAFRERLHSMTWKRILWVVLLVSLVMVGNFMQIVMLNFWLISFPSDGTPGNYTAFAVPGIFFAVLFVLLLGAYAAIRRPSLRFATHLHGWGILLGVGFCDAFNSWMATYAASYTSEVLQALFTNLCPLYAVFLSKWLLRDTRRYANIYITSVFILTILGILAASLYGLIKDRNVSEGRWWILIFFLSMPVRVLMNVFQSLYMIVYTRDANFVSWLRVRFAEETPAVAEAGVDGPGAEERKGEHYTTAVTVEGVEGGASVHRSHKTSSSRSSENDSPTLTATAAAAAKAALHDARNNNNNNNADDDDDEGHADCAAAKKGKRLAQLNSFAVTGEPDSDPSLPVITITTPTQAPHEHHVHDFSSSQHQQPAGTLFDGAYKSPHSRKLSASDPPDLAALGDVEKSERGSVRSGGGHASRDVLPPLVVAEPLFSTTADAQPGPNGDLDDDEEEEIYSPRAAAAPPLPAQTIFTVRYNQGEDTIVKLVMLAGETAIQLCFTLSLLPADALPWWGNSATVDATWENFKEGIRCVFTIQENFLYCFLYTLGFVFTYVGCAYLNHYSAALCSIVSQLSSPVTALMLVIVPSWNVQEDGDSPWYCNVVAIVFLCIAALLYVLWEEMTDHEKVQAEYALKMEQLHVRPSSHEKPHAVVIDG